MKHNPTDLIAAARKARRHAYAPYSNYAVGAAVLGRSGKVYTGCNIENAAYPTGLCAERVAVFKAISEGERQVLALAVVTRNGGSPCGACRQVLSEFAEDDVLIWVASSQGRNVQTYAMQDILPDRFGPRQLTGGTRPKRD